ncbi:hypothetical protein ACIRJR_31300 [Streptomyces sp. NPDC102402]|uniref:hypothetical protein n=1 Tax=Streptomyces sp. NPDC102402 TaxID=3366169 RepID=UPI00381315E9
MKDFMTGEVRDLLARAAETAEGPSLDTAGVFAQASKVRRRRRGVLAAAVLAGVVGGLATVPGVITGGSDRAPAATASPWTDAELTGGSGREQRLTGLLPAGTGKVEEVSLAVLLKDADLEGATSGGTKGALDGGYAVHQDGGVGYLGIALHDRTYVDAKMPGGNGPADDLCSRTGTEEPRADCEREVLAGGQVLTIWRQPKAVDEGTPEWGEELTGRLLLPDGRVLFVRDSAGYRGHGQLGPVLRHPPLPREQLRDLMLRPELVAGK